MRGKWRKLFFVYSSALSIFLLLSPTALAQDDHGDDPATATPIVADGTLYDGEIETEGDVDYFRFSAASGYTYLIETSDLGANCDTVIRLLDTNGQLILEDDDGGTDLASKIEWVASSSDDYYVAVQHYNLTDTGTYKISVTEGEGTPPPQKADICDPCSTDDDCESGNCGTVISGPGDRLCIPAGATSYTCKEGGGGGGGGG